MKSTKKPYKEPVENKLLEKVESNVSKQYLTLLNAINYSIIKKLGSV